MDLTWIAKKALEVAEERHKKEGTEIDTIGLLKHLAGEVVEATEAYTNQLCRRGTVLEFCDELCDVITCAMIIFAKTGQNLDHALLMCQEKNKERAKKEGQTNDKREN